MRFMKRQKDLNFVPGSEYMYYNTGYLLMAEIIDKTKIEIFFGAEKNSIPTMEYTDQKKWVGKRVKEFKTNQEILEEICGTYWSPELETQYILYMKDEKLMGHHPRHGNFAIRYIREDKLNGEPSFFRFFKVKRNNKGKIIGIYVSNSRVRDQKEIAGKSRITKKFRKRARNDIYSPFSIME